MPRMGHTNLPYGKSGLSGMWYFAYGSNLNARAVTDWSRACGHRPPQLKGGRPAVLDNYRLCFAVYSEYWGGGIADIVYDPGKYVGGVLFELSDAEMGVLDAKVGRKLDPGGKEIGVYKRIEVKVSPLGKGEPIQAVTYQGTSADRSHIAPTQHYMDLLIQGAYSQGLSIMWIAYLQTFGTQVGRKPRAPGATGHGDASSRL
ncbi:MAG: gamma-glutamylcyclotransferase family protein [Phycisphaerae bacterium]